MGELISSMLASFGIASAEKAAARLGSLLTEDALQSRPALLAEATRRHAAFLSALEARVARLEQEIGPTVREDLIRRLDDPGFVLLLNASSQAALAIHDEERHEVLAALVAQRALIDETTTRLLIAESAAGLIHKINKSHLATLGLTYFCTMDRPWTNDNDFSAHPAQTMEKYIIVTLERYKIRNPAVRAEDLEYMVSLGLLSMGGAGNLILEGDGILYLNLLGNIPLHDRPDHNIVCKTDWFRELNQLLGEKLVNSSITATGALIGEYFHKEILTR